MVTSRFPFRSNTETASEQFQPMEQDEDGDLMVHRSATQKPTDVIYLGDP